MKIINILKANLAHLISLCLFGAGLILVIVSLFTPMFGVDYFVGGYMEGDVEIPLELVKSDVIGFNYVFANFSSWLELGAPAPYSMFIQICFMILICLAICVVAYIVSFVFCLFKEKLSKKGEFAGSSFSIATAIIGFAVVMLLIIILTTTEAGKQAGFIYNSAVRSIQPAYIMLIVASFLFIISGALNTAAISEKSDN